MVRMKTKRQSMTRGKQALENAAIFNSRAFYSVIKRRTKYHSTLYQKHDILWCDDCKKLTSHKTGWFYIRCKECGIESDIKEVL